MRDDIEKAARAAEAPFDDRVVSSVLEAYRDCYSAGAVSFRTTTKTRKDRGLNIRYVALQVPHDPYRIAIDRGFLAKEDHPVHALTCEIQAGYPVLGYGMDMGSANGLEKIWAFFPQDPQPLTRVCATRSVPDSIRRHADYFARHNLGLFSLFGLDYRDRTCNLYFMIREPGQLTMANVAGMIGDLGFPLPTHEMLDRCRYAFAVYHTFHWDSSQIERICFGMTASCPDHVPGDWHPVIRRYVRESPFIATDRKFIFSVTASRSGSYVKIENDYNGGMTQMIERGQQRQP